MLVTEKAVVVMEFAPALKDGADLTVMFNVKVFVLYVLQALVLNVSQDIILTLLMEAVSSAHFVVKLVLQVLLV